MNLHSHQRCTKVPVSPYPCPHLIFSGFVYAVYILYLLYGVRCGSGLHSYVWISIFPAAFFEKIFLSLLVLAPLLKIIWPYTWGFVSGVSLPAQCSIVYVCLDSVPHCLDYCVFLPSSEIRKWDFSSFDFFKIVSAFQGLLRVFLNFKVVFFSFYENEFENILHTLMKLEICSMAPGPFQRWTVASQPNSESQPSTSFFHKYAVECDR